VPITPSTDEVALFEARLPPPREEGSQRIVALRIARYHDPDNPNADRDIYLFSLTATGETARRLSRSS
jgi:hypothetical protein